MSQALPVDAVEFLLRAVGSPEALEIVLLLRRSDRAWSADEIARQIRWSSERVETTLGGLRSKQVVSMEHEGTVVGWRYAPGSAELGERLDRLASAYGDDRIEVMRAMCECAMERARELASLLARTVAVADSGRSPPGDPTSEHEALAMGSFDSVARRGLKLVEVERAYLLAMLRVTGGNRSEAARRLGIDRRTLQRRLDCDDAPSDVEDDDDPRRD